jgi:hypothetical protein
MLYAFTAITLALLILLVGGGTVAIVALWSSSRTYRQIAEQLKEEGLRLAAQLAERDLHCQAVAKALEIERNVFQEFIKKPIIAALSTEQFQILVREIKSGLKYDKDKELLN